MKIALIKNGVVENVILGTLEFGKSLGYTPVIDVTNQKVGVGDKYENGVFIKAEATQEDTEAIKATIEEQIAQLQQQLSALE